MWQARFEDPDFAEYSLHGCLMQECLSTMCCPWIRVPVQVVSTTSNHRHCLLVGDTKRGFPAMLGSLAPKVSGLPEVRALPTNRNNNSPPPKGNPIQVRLVQCYTLGPGSAQCRARFDAGVDLTLKCRG